jgi:hypothetical protein
MTTQAIQRSGDMMNLTFEQTLKLGDVLAATGYFKDVNSAGRAVAAILYGRELGIGPMAALMGISIIEGKPAPGANLMAALIKRSGRYNYRVRTWTDKLCEIDFFEDGTACGTASFSWEEAQQITDKYGKALTDKPNWRNYRKAMLFARAMSQGARAFCADVFGGAPVYSPEELGADVTLDDSGEMHVLTAPALPPHRAADPPADDPDEAAAEDYAASISTPPRASTAQIAAIRAWLPKAGIPEAEVCQSLNVSALEGLTREMAGRVVDRLAARATKPPAEPAPAADAPTIPDRRNWAQPAPPSPVVNGLAVGGAPSEKQIKAVYAIGYAVRGKDRDAVDAECAARYNDRRPEQLTRTEISAFIDALKGDAVAAEAV